MSSRMVNFSHISTEWVNSYDIGIRMQLFKVEQSNKHIINTHFVFISGPNVAIISQNFNMVATKTPVTHSFLLNSTSVGLFHPYNSKWWSYVYQNKMALYQSFMELQMWSWSQFIWLRIRQNYQVCDIVASILHLYLIMTGQLRWQLHSTL